MKTCEEIRNDWKEIRPKLGNLINAMEAKIDETGNYEAAYTCGYADGVNNPSSVGFQHGYEAGLDAAWGTALRIFKLPASDFHRIYDAHSYVAMFDKCSASEAMQKLKEYDDEKAEIHVGDIVYNQNNYRNAVVLSKHNENGHERIMVAEYNGDNKLMVHSPPKAALTKTGKRIEIADMLKIKHD